MSSLTFHSNNPSLAFQHNIPLNFNNCIPHDGRIPFKCKINSIICPQNKHYKMYKRAFHSSRQSAPQRKILQHLLASFDYEANNNDRSKKDKVNYSDNYNYDEDEEEVDSDYFLNFDDESLLEELMVLSDDFDEEDNLLFDVENELEELERFIDEQNTNNIKQTNLSQLNNNTDGLKRIKIEDERQRSNKISSPSSSSALEEARMSAITSSILSEAMINPSNI